MVPNEYFLFRYISSKPKSGMVILYKAFKGSGWRRRRRNGGGSNCDYDGVRALC